MWISNDASISANIFYMIQLCQCSWWISNPIVGCPFIRENFINLGIIRNTPGDGKDWTCFFYEKNISLLVSSSRYIFVFLFVFAIVIAWLSLDFILYTSWVALSSVVCEASVSPDQISTFSNIYRHKTPILTLYQLIESRTVYLV